MQESVYQNRQIPSNLPDDAPNILIILIDDSGPALPNTFGGEVNTPSLTKLSKEGISYNRFHSTAMCSPTRASLLTGRNHTRVSTGQITEFANDWDGFSGVIPKSAATVAEVLRNYGYSTSAFGKWHNTPTPQTSETGPFEFWPTGYGFEYFYGFLAGEASQYEPNLVKNTTLVHPPKTPEEGYHLTEDLADNAIEWIRKHQAIHQDKPFLMYWATGAVHGPHHVHKEWADKYKGKFDDGWDNYRTRVFENQKKLGWTPENTILTERPEGLQAWNDIPENERPFQRRLMEVFAGFTEHTDFHAGRIIDELEHLGIKENTLIFYIWGDNGSSAEGQQGTISELLAQNQIPTQISDHLRVVDELGGLDVIGSPKTDNMYHAGWAWAGSTPFRGTKLLASFFGGIRQPMVVSWPKEIMPDDKVRSQFHHVNDIVPTIYEILNIEAPQVVNGFQQIPIDGVSMAYSFSDPDAKGRLLTQFFDIMGSRAIYHDGWMASTFGPRIPWVTVTPGIQEWTPDKDVWELFNLEEDFSQANDLSQEFPEKLEALKELFLIESAKNQNLPIGGGLYMFLHPDSLSFGETTEFQYHGHITRVPEAAAPRIGTIANKTTIEAEIPKNGNGVLFSIGGYAGGLTCYMRNGIIHYEYNQFLVSRTFMSGKTKVPEGKAKIEIDLNTKPNEMYPHLKSGELTLYVNGKEYLSGHIPILATVGFTANDCFDIGEDLGSPVSDAYFKNAPFKFNGKVNKLEVAYK
ncbi:arylsulfatase [Pararhodonellum marinum]|uniref:arylsulfatase n=1 Tax=Pararhodonellum marinum TaxID=2755358 RepID=UPI001E6146FF|nr:arylsulfatase [Pararhodonellum marinum]